ncbi:hypothetical protein ABW16_01785 [Mycolicibacter heraklionensis]|uniref:DUF2190 domain-containing protein n=1 Tax=Mycolicibacter heraklionensis TaxID=512402 RepID=A0ABR5FL16_9MYCO|nr:capsid cement protein [Mycolicibacter heraklionensis]KLO31589.1 hypothetical protein ABW16_01785 [Mycolicibacter heraklionensis]
MAGTDYMPKFLGGCTITCIATADITAGQLVVNSGDYKVAPASAAAAKQFGVAVRTVKAGQKVAVWFEGVHPLAASGAIAAGAPVIAAASGAVAAAAVDTPVGQIVGYAMAAAANSLVDVRLSY